MKPDAKPIVLAIPLDHGAEDVLDAALELAARLGAPLLPVHAVSMEYEGLPQLSASAPARDTIAGWLEPLAKRGLVVLEPVVEKGRADQLVPFVAAREGAQLTIVGSGRGATIRDWLLGTTAERIVRASAGLVWIARGTLPGPALPVLVPIDLGDETRLAIIAGARWARLFGATLRILHVLPGVEPLGSIARAGALADLHAGALADLAARARTRVAEVLGQIDVEVPVDVRFAHGPIGASLVREAEDVGLVVITQRDYEMLVPASLGSHVERLMRMSRSSVLAVRDDDIASQRVLREERATWVGVLRREAEEALVAGDAARAERLLVSAKVAAPTSPRIEDVLARAIESQGRPEEAERHRTLARWLRAELA